MATKDDSSLDDDESGSLMNGDDKDNSPLDCNKNCDGSPCLQACSVKTTPSPRDSDEAATVLFSSGA
ncbi:hypothetical protein S245_011759 [Arachis hypogaea]|nr:uncharacterized protein DS421_4g110430 [Arachis hypogaea]